MNALRHALALLALLYAALVGSPTFAQLAPGTASIGAPAPDAVAPTYSFDFGTGVYSMPFETAFTFARTGTKTNLFPASPPGFAWTSFPANTMVIDPILGVNIERSTPFNYYPFSTAPGRVVTTSSLAAGDYVLWITSSDGGGQICVAPGTGAISNGRLSATSAEPSSDLGTKICARQNASVMFQVQSAGTVVLTRTGSVQTAQLENAPGGRRGGTSFIITAADPVQRTPDSLDFAGSTVPFIAIAPSTATNTFIVSGQATEATQYTGIMWALGNAAFAPGLTFTVGYSNDSNGVNQRVNTLGSGSLLSPFKVAIATSNSARKLVVNGGAATGGSRLIASTLTVNTQTRFGGNASFSWNGWIRSWSMYQGLFMPDWQMRQKTTPAGREPNGIVYGDSLSARNSPSMSRTNASVWQKIETLSGGRYRFRNATREGNQFTDGKADQLAVGDFDKITVIWLGTNVGANASAMMADLASMVSLVKNGRYLIVSAINWNNVNGQTGGSQWTLMTDFNAQAAALYGSKFLDLRTTLVASGIPNDKGDAADAARDVPVRSTRTWIYQGALTAPMDAAQTNWSAYPNPGSATVRIGDELLTPTTRSGANVTLGQRGVSGSTPAAHPQGALIWTWDEIHQSDRGVTIDAEMIKARLDTLYGAALSHGLDLPALPEAANDNGAVTLAA